MDIYELPSIARSYPRPKVPMLPLFEFNDLRLQPARPGLSRFLEPDVAFMPSGRVAIYYALQLLGVGEGSEVLVPAYHCGSMIEPIIYLKATPRLIHLSPDLQITPEQVEPLIGPRTRAVLLPHYFGFPQDLAPIRALCDQHQIALIEDCAHSFFSRYHDQPVGAIGDFSITSTVKFYPGVEGGILASNQAKRITGLIPRKPPSLTRQLKTIVNTLEAAAAYQRLGTLGALLRLRANGISSAADGGDTSDQLTRPLNRDNLRWFEPGDIGADASWFTRLVTRKQDASSLIQRRREHFQHYLQQLSDLPGVRPLYNELPDGVVPYIFPLLLERPESTFQCLKQLGVPIWRWEELVLSDCPVSNDYRLRLIQLPCHQALLPPELGWIIQTITATVTEAA